MRNIPRTYMSPSQVGGCLERGFLFRRTIPVNQPRVWCMAQHPDWTVHNSQSPVPPLSKIHEHPDHLSHLSSDLPFFRPSPHSIPPVISTLGKLALRLRMVYLHDFGKHEGWYTGHVCYILSHSWVSRTSGGEIRSGIWRLRIKGKCRLLLA